MEGENEGCAGFVNAGVEGREEGFLLFEELQENQQHITMSGIVWKWAGTWGRLDADCRSFLMPRGLWAEPLERTLEASPTNHTLSLVTVLLLMLHEVELHSDYG